MDENYTPDIVSVVDEDGTEHVFEELDRIETEDARYVALLPVYDEAEEILEDDGELIILKVSEEDGETYLLFQKFLFAVQTPVFVIQVPFLFGRVPLFYSG